MEKEKVVNVEDKSGQMLSLMLGGNQAYETMEDRLSDKVDEIEKLMNDSVAIGKSGIKRDGDKVKVGDAYGNSLLAIGTDDKVESFTNYGFSNSTLNYPLWLALYNDSWVFARAIDKPARDEVKCGISLRCDNEKKDEIMKKMNKARPSMIRLLKWGALFGGSIAVVMFDTFSDEDYNKDIKLNIDKIKRAKTIRYYVTDRWYGCQQSSEVVEDMNNIDFEKPKKYTVTFADGSELEVDHSYILRYEHRDAPNLIKKGQLMGWGYAEGSHILNELSRDDKLKASIQSLIDKALIEIIKMPGMRGIFMGTDDASSQQLKKRLEMVNWARGINSLTFLDKDDEYSKNEFSGLSGLSDLLQNNMLLVAASLEMQGVLFGDLKSGLAVDSSALERYDETIQGRCEDYLRPVYEKLLSILYLMYGIEEEVDFSFNSLLMKEKTEKRIKDIGDFVNLGVQLQDAGIISPKLLAKAVQNYTTKDEINFGLTDEVIEKLSDEEEIEKEDFKVSEREFPEYHS